MQFSMSSSNGNFWVCFSMIAILSRVRLGKCWIMQRASPLYNLPKTHWVHHALKCATGSTGLQKNRAMSEVKKSASHKALKNNLLHPQSQESKL